MTGFDRLRTLGILPIQLKMSIDQRRRKLERAVLALAQPADIQLSLFPDFVCKADELALDFEEAINGVVEHDGDLADHERLAIDELDRLILSQSGEKHLDFWTEEALLSDPIWEDIRNAARSAAETCGWELRRPPPSGAIYIGGV